jgi:predicted HAD superfamily phosphohydrolase YqeG
VKPIKSYSDGIKQTGIKNTLSSNADHDKLKQWLTQVNTQYMQQHVDLSHIPAQCDLV